MSDRIYAPHRVDVEPFAAIEALREGPFVPLSEFHPPDAAGIYAIKLALGAWNGTFLHDTDAADPAAVAYVGKAEGGRRSLAKRWEAEHLDKHSGRSSPRRSWLAVLAPAWEIPIYPRPCNERGRPNVNCYVSDRDGESRLLAWIQRHYRVHAVSLDGLANSTIEAIEKKAICRLEPYASDGTPNILWWEIFRPARNGATEEARKRRARGELLPLDHHY